MVRAAASIWVIENVDRCHDKRNQVTRDPNCFVKKCCWCQFIFLQNIILNDIIREEKLSCEPTSHGLFQATYSLRMRFLRTMHRSSGKKYDSLKRKSAVNSITIDRKFSRLRPSWRRKKKKDINYVSSEETSQKKYPSFCNRIATGISSRAYSL